MRGNFTRYVSGASERGARTALTPLSLFGLGDDAIRRELLALPAFGAYTPRGWTRGEVFVVGGDNVEQLGELARTKRGAGFGVVSETANTRMVAIYYPV